MLDWLQKGSNMLQAIAIQVVVGVTVNQTGIVFILHHVEQKTFERKDMKQEKNYCNQTLYLIFKTKFFRFSPFFCSLRLMVTSPHKNQIHHQVTSMRFQPKVINFFS